MWQLLLWPNAYDATKLSANANAAGAKTLSTSARGSDSMAAAAMLASRSGASRWGAGIEDQPHS